MTTLDWIDVVLLIVLVISTILNVVLFIIANFYLGRVRAHIKRLEKSPFFQRDLNGRPLRERK